MRPGRSSVVWLEYANTGDSDLPMPLFIVSSPSGTPFGLVPGDVVARDLPLLALNPSGPAGTLPPGSSNKIPIYFTGTPVPQAKFEYRIIRQTNDPIAWDRLGIDHDYLPPGYEIELNDLWQRIDARFGTTWASFLSALGEGAQQYGTELKPRYAVPCPLRPHGRRTQGIGASYFRRSAPRFSGPQPPVRCSLGTTVLRMLPFGSVATARGSRSHPARSSPTSPPRFLSTGGIIPFLTSPAMQIFCFQI